MQPDDQKMENGLDSALRQYGMAEPRLGLETRVLASLRAERQRRPPRRKWWLLAGSMATAAVIAGLWLGWSASDRAGDKAEGTSSPVANSHEPRPDFGAPASPGAVKVANASRSRKAGHVALTAVSAQPPRMEQFPSRESSEQYKLLAMYAQRAPNDEVNAVIAEQKSSGDLLIRDLDITPLSGEAATLQSGEQN